MKHNTLLVSILFVSLAFIASACAGINNQDPNTSTFEQVAKNGTVRVGVRFDNPPLSFITEDGQWVGFDVDLANALVDELGFEIDMVKVDGTTRISFLQEDKIDLAVASMNHTRSRDDAIDFSITYFWDNQSFLIRKGTYSSLDEIMGAKVAANAGSSTIDSWKSFSEKNGGPDPEIVEFTDKLAAMQALRDGVVEGYTEDNITLLALAAGDPNLELIPGGHNQVQFGIGLPVNDSKWRDQVNYALQELWKNGTYQEIYDKWFVGSDAAVPLPLSGQMEIWP
ncbi:MAG: transporter substrate-binding domain-containing protein [Anaerolineales bacterium]|nr:transporter substrate-binding domain-containing protein [Chloroflexota bacterium]MBL6983846.1 transporter substrate-binding domain-containing protein [Anaerolineales bacterium]